MSAVSSRTHSAPRAVAAGVNGGGVLSRERVGEIQRARILTAMTELVRERGVTGVTVAHVVGRSGVSRRTFYELFGDREDCLLAAFEQAVERAAAVVIPAYEEAGATAAGVGATARGATARGAGARGATAREATARGATAGGAGAAGGAWEPRIREGLGALLGFLDEEPTMGGLCVVDALAADRAVLERRARVVGVLIDEVHQGGALRKGGPGGPGRRPGRIVAEGAVGAVLAVIHARLSEPDPKPLAGLLNQLMGMIVLPYLGPEAAARELARPAPRARKRPTAPADPLRDLGMRLTYRTVRVLLAISELAGEGSSPSSREVADASGVADQGQMSKLLWRLESLGLIDTAVRHHGRGEPNAWSLTAKGQEVERAIRSQTAH